MFLALAVVAIAWLLLFVRQPVEQSHRLPAVITTGPTVEKLQSLEELVIQRVTVSDILSYTDGGTISASWLVRGDGLITISLSQAEIALRDEQSRTATIVLPLPTVLSARVDHEQTIFWDAKQGIWNKVNPWGKNLDEIHSQAMKAAQRLVTLAVGSPENLEQAQQRAKGLIQRIYAEFGWAVTIEWRTPPTARESRRDSSSTEVTPFPRVPLSQFRSLSAISPPAVIATAH